MRLMSFACLMLLASSGCVAKRPPASAGGSTSTGGATLGSTGNPNGVGVGTGVELGSGEKVAAPGVFSLTQSQVTSSAAGLLVGSSMTVTLTARDASGISNPSGIVAQSFIVSSPLPTSGTGSFGPITSQGNGVYTATFTATQPGQCILRATLNGSQLTSSASPAAIIIELLAYSVRYLFQGGNSDGAGPMDSLSLSPDGLTLYGMTNRGGPLGAGSIFKMPAAGGSPTYLHFFTGGVGDGQAPTGSLTVSADGATLYGMTSGGGEGSAPGYGTIFSIPAAGGSPTYLTLFKASGGFGPRGSLTLSMDGATLYGATANGAAAGPGTTSFSNYGTLFSLPITGGSPTYLYSFKATTSDGSIPLGALVLSQDGATLYGMTAYGGPATFHGGSIFSIPATGGSPTYLHFFTNGPGDGGLPFGSLTLSPDGSKLYGMTLDGGPAGRGSIFSIPVTGGSPNYFHFFAGGPNDGSSPQGALNLSADGSKLFGMTEKGGVADKGVIFSLPTSGGNLSILHSFTGSANDQGSPQGSLILSADRTTVFGMTLGLPGLGSVFSIPVQ